MKIQKNSKERLSELQSAKSHSKRAIYDAIEVRALYFIAEFRRFEDDYGTVVISEIVPTYDDILEKIRNLTELVLDETKKDEKLEIITEITNDLEIEIEKLDANRDLLNKKIAKERKQAFLYIIIAILGLTISLYVTINTFFFPERNVDIDVSVSDRIDELDNIQTSLKKLSEYVNIQKDTLSDMKYNIKNLKTEKDNLEKILETKKKSVDAIIHRYVKESSSMKIYEIIVSFVTGALASLVASLIVSYLKQRKSEKT